MDYEINCPDDFYDILQGHISKNKTEGNTYTVTGDLDFNGAADFNPLGSGTKYTFDGKLDGQGHVIKNLTVNGSQSYHLGLFDTIGQKGSVTDLQLQSVVIKQDLSGTANPTTQTCAGALAAVCYGNINRCCADGNILLEVSTDYSKAGGLCGSLPLQSASITDSWANVSIKFSPAVSGPVSGRASRAGHLILREDWRGSAEEGSAPATAKVKFLPRRTGSPLLRQAVSAAAHSVRRFLFAITLVISMAEGTEATWRAGSREALMIQASFQTAFILRAVSAVLQ